MTTATNECTCVYPVSVGEAPDSSSHLHSEDDEQEEEELNKNIREFVVPLPLLLLILSDDLVVCLLLVSVKLNNNNNNKYQPKHARGFFNGTAAPQETNYHHQSPCCNQDVHTYDKYLLWC